MATILIVDDHAVNREFLVTLLGYHRHRLLEASDGAQALAMARVEHPDLVISDILMPTMDGFEFVRRLRMDPALEATPVVFYTAHYHNEEAQRLARDCGVSYVLTKPSEPELVLQTVAQALGQSKPPTPAPTPDFDREHLRILTDKLSEEVEKLRRTSERFAALNSVNLQLASETDPRRLLDSVCQSARELTAAKYALLAVGGKVGTTTNEFTTSGLEKATAARIGHPVWRESAARAALQQGKALRVTNPGGEATAVGLPTQHLPVYSLLVAPIVSLEHNYGWIALVDKLGAKEFSAEDELLVAALGAQLGRFYENGSLYAEMRRHAAKLQESELRLREREAGLHRAQLMAKLAHVITRPDGSFESWSETLPQLMGVGSAQMPRSTREWLDIVHPEDRSLFRATAIQAGIEGARKELEYRLRASNDSWIHIWQVIEPIHDGADADGKMRWFNTLQDVTEQKEAEKRIGRLNRVYAVLSGINALIVRVRDRDELFREACRIAVQSGQFPLAWVAVADPGDQMVKAVAWAGDERGYVQLTRPTVDAKGQGKAGLSARAMEERIPVVCNDIEADTSAMRFGKEALERGYRSVAAFPFVVGGAVIGALVLYAAETGFFDAEEMKLLIELAGDIAFALDHIAKVEKLDYLAYYDTLTGLANPTLFRERVAQHIAMAAAQQRKFAVALLDIDHFRTINDSLGRQAGDELLKQVAARLESGPGRPHTIARLSADHFAAALQDIRHESEIAHRLEELNRHCLDEPFQINGNELRITGKSGIAVYPNDGTDADALLRNAEFALRKAKASGEPRVFYTHEMTKVIAERIRLENRLQQALEKEEFVLHYQPKVDLESRQIQGVEALIRWQSPDLGLVPPLKFISVLEETGMIVEVGAWALRRAILDHRDWLRQKLMAPRVAVNVSAIQLRHRDFIDVVKETLKQGATRPGIDIEITESLIMDDVAGTIDKLKTLRGLGVSIAIDDFGTGYSSLGYLAQLPVHSLKIDRSFIITMADDPNTMTLVSTIISLAHSLRLKVCAEGVETEEQAKVLRLLRCDEMQGYLISRPVPVEKLTPLLAPAAA